MAERNHKTKTKHFGWLDASYVMTIPKRFGSSIGFHKTKDGKRLFVLCENGVFELKRRNK